MNLVAEARPKLSADIAYIDRKLELLERVLVSMSDAIDNYDDFEDDFDVDFDDDDDDDDWDLDLDDEGGNDHDCGCVVVHDRFHALRNCIIDAEEIIAELRAKLGTSDGKVFP